MRIALSSNHAPGTHINTSGVRLIDTGQEHALGQQPMAQNASASDQTPNATLPRLPENHTFDDRLASNIRSKTEIKFSACRHYGSRVPDFKPGG
jgi:hypothetical protein